MSESTPRSGAELLAAIRPQLAEARVQLCLRPDLLDRWEELNEALAGSQQQDLAAGRLAGGDSAQTVALAEELQALEVELEAASPWFTMRALPQPRWQALIEKHPPRKDNPLDLFSGYNVDTVRTVLVRVCLIDPVFTPYEDDEGEVVDPWEQFLETLNPSEWNALRDAASEVNKAVTTVPKSAAAALVLSRRAVTSEPPELGESTPARSTGSRRRKSTGTSTPTGT